MALESGTGEAASAHCFKRLRIVLSSGVSSRNKEEEVAIASSVVVSYKSSSPNSSSIRSNWRRKIPGVGLETVREARGLAFCRV